jgi:hypothetical protein
MFAYWLFQMGIAAVIFTRCTLMKAIIVNTLNILFTLVIFTPFVYTQTSVKHSCKNAAEKTITVNAASVEPIQQTYLIDIH